MKHILIPSDLRIESDPVWQYVLPLVKTMGASLHFVHAVDDPFVKDERDHVGAEGVDKITSDLVYKYRDEADKAMIKLLDRVKAAMTGMDIHVEGHVRNGNAEEVILHEAAEIQPQLIVMGSHDHSKLDRMFFGSVTQAIIRRSHFPVLAIPEKYIFKPVNQIVYMSDLDNNDTISIAKLLNLFGGNAFNLHITHFNLDEVSKDEGLYAIGDKIRNDHKEVQIDFEVVDARVLRDAYKQYISMKNIDLIALTTRKDHGMMRFINPGTAIDVLYHSKLPVLIFHRA